MEASVSPVQQSRAPAVVRHSRLGSVLACAWLCLYPTLARADAVPESPPRGYGPALGAAYLVAPVLALAVGGGMFELTGNDTIAVASGCSMFLLPPFVHVANGGGGRGAAAFGSMILVTALGVGGGGGLGYAIGAASCDEDTESDCDLVPIGLFIVGALAGGILGYGTHAVVDTAENSDLPVEEGSAGSVSITPWVMPIAAPARSREGTGRAFNGASLGATLTW
jgi:hypothetical protein